MGTHRDLQRGAAPVKAGAAIALVFLLSLAGGRAAGAPAIALSLAQVSRGANLIEGSFEVAADSRQVWDVLTDYEHIPEFVPSMESSRVEDRRPDSLLVEQKSSVAFLFLRRRIKLLLRVEQEPFREIRFKDVSRDSFDVYEGRWQIEPSPQGTRVTYRLKALSRSAFKFAVKAASRKAVAGLLSQVREEILRRSRLAAN